VTTIPAPHEWDDEAVCVHCGFDGAEHWWWSRDTYEGRAAPEEERRMPPCRDPLTGNVRMMKVPECP
jgi:hypothetical protein